MRTKCDRDLQKIKNMLTLLNEFDDRILKIRADIRDMDNNLFNLIEKRNDLSDKYMSLANSLLQQRNMRKVTDSYIEQHINFGNA